MFRRCLIWLGFIKEDLKKAIDGSLLSLGETADEVASHFNAHGIRGNRRDVFFDPVSNWIRRRTPEKIGFDTYVCVSNMTYAITYQSPTSQNGVKHITAANGNLPPAIQEFICRFDHLGHFSFLLS